MESADSYRMDERKPEITEEKESVSTGSTWFDKMCDAIKWKVVVPNLHDPFQVKIPDRVLIELADSEQSRRKMSDLRCLCDGYEVMNVRNILAPQFVTSHPCISSMSRQELNDYIKLPHIEEIIQAELDKLRHDAAEELDRRHVEAEKEAQRMGTNSQKKKTKKDKEAGKTGDANFRVIRM